MMSHDGNVYIAKLTEPTEEIVEFLKKVAKTINTSEELTVKELNLLSITYESVVGSHYVSWNIISSIEHEEKCENEDHMAFIKNHCRKIEAVLDKICNWILIFLNFQLIPSTNTAVSNVFYHCRKIETVLDKICDWILMFLDLHLIPSTNTAVSNVFYLKKKSDYHRYLAEFRIRAS